MRHADLRLGGQRSEQEHGSESEAEHGCRFVGEGHATGSAPAARRSTLCVGKLAPSMLAPLLALVPQTQEPPARPAPVRVSLTAKAPADGEVKVYPTLLLLDAKGGVQHREVGYQGVAAMVKFFATRKSI